MLEIDLSEFERKARSLGGAIDQVPFALANSLNDAAFATRSFLISDTWPTHVTVRNRGFIRAALRVEKATKGNLEVAVVDTLGRAHLKLHANGGIKQARGRLAIPTNAVKRGAGGVSQKLKPRNLRNAVLKGNLLFQAQGRGKAKKLKLMFKLQSSARIKRDVPFFEDFSSVMRREIAKAYPKQMQRAMQTRR